MATYIQEGDSVDYTPIADVAAGAVVVIGGGVGVANRPIEANKLGALAVKGIFDFAHVADVISVNAAVYWDVDGDPVGGTVGTGCATATSSGNIFVGWAIRAAAVGDTQVRVNLFGAPEITNNHYGPLNNAITDPGNVTKAIPVTASGYVDLVTTGAETRTLAAPAFKGQELLLSLKTDGGDCVVTCVTTINQTGNNTITMNDAGDAIRLVAKTSGANIRWSVVSNDGTALTTV